MHDLRNRRLENLEPGSQVGSMSAPRVVIVGAGPAGTRAAQLLHERRCHVTVVHEGPASGGQIYRRQPTGFTRSARQLYGADADKATRLHETFDRLRSSIEVRANTTVFNVFDARIAKSDDIAARDGNFESNRAGKLRIEQGQLYLHGPDGLETLPYDKLVLATGAMDRILPMPGWTLPGVFTLGGAQIALKHQACAIGRRVAFVGTGPLLYLVAYQYVKAGATVAGVFDTSAAVNKRRALPMLLAKPQMLARGLGYRLRLRASGVPICEGIVPQRVCGETRVSGFAYRCASGEFQDVDCDAVGLGYGLKPESQLAELLGVPQSFDEQQRVRVISHDGAGRAAPDIYVAGDGVAIGGADVAELTGELAAWSLLADLGQEVSSHRVAAIRRQLQSHARFRRGLDIAFPVPISQLHSISDGTLLCRCEGVTVGAIRAAVARFEPDDVNRLKALVRPGMGRCQGRICGLAASELLAHERELPVQHVGFMRSQAPIKPVPFDVVAKGAEEAVASAVRTGLAKEAVE
jgi:hydrogen cyanide synthase HcnB